MTAVVFLLYDGIEKEIVKGIYLVLEINRRIMTYLYSKTIFCALMDSYKWMTNISTPYVYQIENAENIKRISFILSSDAQKLFHLTSYFIFVFYFTFTWSLMYLDYSFLCVFYALYLWFTIFKFFDEKCCNRLLYNAQFQIKYMNMHVYNYFIVIVLSI